MQEPADSSTTWSSAGCSSPSGSLRRSRLSGGSSVHQPKSPQQPLRLKVGEIRFDVSPLRRSPSQGPSLPPPLPHQLYSDEHTKNNEMLLAQRKLRLEQPGSTVRSARAMSLEEEEAAYEAFKRSYTYQNHNISGTLSTAALHQNSGVVTGSSPLVLPSISLAAPGSSPYDASRRRYPTNGNSRSPPPPPMVAGGGGAGGTSTKSSRVTLVTLRGLGGRTVTVKPATAGVQETTSSPRLQEPRTASSGPTPAPRHSVKLGVVAPTTPPPRSSDSAHPPKPQFAIPKINFRVGDSGISSPIPDTLRIQSPRQANIAADSDHNPIGVDDIVQYSNPWYYAGYCGSPFDDTKSAVSARSDTLPQWALPPLPIGTSDTPRLISATPLAASSSASAMDTARNDEHMLAWRKARLQGNFRGRAVLNTSAERSKVDLEAANMPWNERFQSLIELPCFTPQDAEQQASAIARLQAEFRDAVLPVVETILMERHVTEKTVPIEPLGGVAGGEKYVLGNIVIKLAHSKAMLELYRNSDRAAKSVANEQKGLQFLSGGEVPLLHYPLGMMVRCFGHCAWACAKVPINASTLRCGSSDGGKTVVEPSDAGAKAIMEAIGAALNLKRHRVGKHRVELYGPADLEIHCGLDGRYYALDTARLLPPDGNPLFAKSPNFYLYRSLRRELLMSWPIPLSADAFSPFGRDGHSEHDEEVRAASLHITDVRIPQLVSAVERDFRTVTLRDTNINWSGRLHEKGVNLRYMGFLLESYLKHCSENSNRPHQPFVTHLIAEIVARSFAACLREDLLKVPVSSSTTSLSPFIDVILRRFNELLSGSDTPASEATWISVTNTMVEKFAVGDLLRKRTLSLRLRSTASLANVNSDWFYRLLWRRASELMGVQWHLDENRESDESWFARLGGPGTGQPVVAGQEICIFTAPLIARISATVRMCDTRAQQVVQSLIAQKRLAEAEQRCMAELRVRSGVLGESPAIVPLLHSIANLFAMPMWGPNHPRLADALAYSERAVRVFQRRSDKEEISMSRQQSEQLCVEAKEGDGEELVGDADESQKAAAPQGAPQSVPLLPKLFWEAYAASLASHARLLREAHRLQEALDVVATALQIAAEHGVENKVLTASLHSSQALTWRRLGKLQPSYESATAACIVAEGMYLAAQTKVAAEHFAESLCLVAEAASLLGYRVEAQKKTQRAAELVGLPALISQRSGDAPSDTFSVSRRFQDLIDVDEDDGRDANVLYPEEGYVVQAEPPDHQSTSSGPLESLLLTTVQAVVLTSWIDVRCDWLYFEGSVSSGASGSVTMELPLADACHAMTLVRKTIAAHFGESCIEMVRVMIVSAQLQRLQGNYLRAMRLCEEAKLLVRYLYGELTSPHEAEVLLRQAEMSFMVGFEQRGEGGDDEQSHLSSPAVAGTLSPRLQLVTGNVRQAMELLTRLGAEHTPLFAYAQTIFADAHRVSPRSTPSQLNAALAAATRAVTILQQLHVHNSKEMIYALNVSSILRIQQDPHAVVIPDLFRALASSDRFMTVANSDFYTQESISLCQTRNRHAPGAKFKIVLSRDGLMRKLQGLLMSALMLLSHDELLEAARVAKRVATLFRDLFSPLEPWSIECAPVLPLLRRAATTLLGRTGSVPGPVTDIGLRLRRLASDETDKLQQFVTQELDRTRSEEEARVAEVHRTKLDRLISQIKQVGIYFGTRAFQNGLVLLHPLLDAFHEMFPNGAVPNEPQSIVIHNLIVKHILFARSCIEGDSPSAGGSPSSTAAKLPSLLEDLLVAEDRVVGTLVEAITIADPTAFTGWSRRTQEGEGGATREPADHDDGHQPDDDALRCMSRYKIGFGVETPSAQTSVTSARGHGRDGN